MMGFAAPRTPLLTAVLAAGLLGCQPSLPAPREPAAEIPSGAGATSAAASDDLRAAVDQALDLTLQTRELSLERHAAWQLLHGVLAFGERFEMTAQGRPVSVVDWVFAGKPMRGWTMHATPQGIRAEIEPGKIGQGHEDQWLAILAQGRTSPSRKLTVAGREYAVTDLVKRSMYDCWDDKEASWSIIALSSYLEPIDQRWKAQDGQEWTVERLVSIEAGSIYDDAGGQELILNGACGGTHRLIGLAIALNNYRRHFPDRELAGGWAAAQRRISWAIEQAQANQLPSGALSIAYFQRPADSTNLDEHLGATGHTLEFLAFALSKRQLQQAWVERAVRRLCVLFELTRDLDLECGALYHAAHALTLYREKVWGVPPMPSSSAAAAPLAAAGR